MCNLIKTYCHRCLSSKVKKNGLFNKLKTQQYKCKDCCKKFFLSGSSYCVSEEKKTLIKDLLLERLPLRGVCSVVKVSRSWLMGFLKEIYHELPNDLNLKLYSNKKASKGRFVSQGVLSKLMSFGVLFKVRTMFSMFG